MQEFATLTAHLERKNPGFRILEIAASAALGFFGTNFYQTLGHQDETENLRPFGNDVSDDLAPFAVGVHGLEGDYPADAGHQKKQCK